MLIQIGGLGVITAAVTFLLFAGKNVSLKERSAMQEAIAAPAIGGIVRLTKFILKGTLLIEVLGALLLLPVFYGDYGQEGRLDGEYFMPYRLFAMRALISSDARGSSICP